MTPASNDESRRPLRGQLIALTLAKTVSNTALRWVGPFLPTLERAFSASTATLTGVMGVAELGGLSTLVTGRYLDRQRERLVFLASMACVVASSAIALVGSLPAFAISFALLVLGVGNLTSAGHAWIGHRVPFSGRGRAIGAFETSWAIALLVGAPLLALAIDRWGWRGAYVALLVASVAGLLLAAAGMERDRRRAAVPTAADDAVDGVWRGLQGGAWPPILASAAMAAAGLGTFIVAGAWLDDAHGVSTAGIGVVAAGFGLVELAASTSVASFADRLGATRSVAAGLVVLLTGIAVMALAGESMALAVAGLVVFLAGFEYGFVASLTVVTEAAPTARGAAIGVANATGTLARAGAVFASGRLYSHYGFSGSLTMSAVAAIVALALIARTRR